MHRIMVPANARGNVTFIAPEGQYSLEDKILELDFNGTKKARPPARVWLSAAGDWTRQEPAMKSAPVWVPVESTAAAEGGQAPPSCGADGGQAGRQAAGTRGSCTRAAS